MKDLTILFYPEPLNGDCRVHYACHESGIKYHNNPEKYYDIIFFWSYTKTTCVQDDFIRKSPVVINRGCYDITKSRIEAIFESGININPETYNGNCVRKSELQGAHDGTIIKCPSRKESGFVYQKLIDTKNENDSFVDYRLFFSGKIDFVLRKEKSEMFYNGESSLTLIEPKEILSDSNIEYIIEKCKSFGLDFGEVDVLIDKSGEVYIIDVNNVAGMGNYWQSALELKEKYRKSFVEFLEKRI